MHHSHQRFIRVSPITARRFCNRHARLSVRGKARRVGLSPAMKNKPRYLAQGSQMQHGTASRNESNHFGSHAEDTPFNHLRIVATCLYQGNRLLGKGSNAGSPTLQTLPSRAFANLFTASNNAHATSGAFSACVCGKGQSGLVLDTRMCQKPLKVEYTPYAAVCKLAKSLDGGFRGCIPSS